MNRLKRILISMQGKSKTELHWLYNTNANDPDEEEKIFTYKDMNFWCQGTGFRNSEKLLLFVAIPDRYFEKIRFEESVPLENYLLYRLSPAIRELEAEYQNDKKNTREKASFTIQSPDGCMEKKSGCRYDQARQCFVLCVHFTVPLVNAVSVNGKAAVRAMKALLECIETELRQMDTEEIQLWITTYEKQRRIQKYMEENGLCAFIADGSILPREGDTEKPLKSAIPFVSPQELRTEIPLDRGEKIIGMGIRKGITVITGGGYSGKSTLLDAIEQGIYHHIPGDGREYVLTDRDALKVDAEDGRMVESVNLTPFFRKLGGEETMERFCTKHASGSVSQAANIVEAVCGGAKLLMIDEDKSATNFLIRDRNMRRIVPNEPIIPFTDRVEELYEECGVSSILVIGGSSAYLAYADTVILMEQYVPQIITSRVQKLFIEKVREARKAEWMQLRRLKAPQTSQAFLFFRSVVTENEKKIVLDDFSADITHLTALSTADQLNTLSWIMESILTDQEASSVELMDKLREKIENAFGEENQNRSGSILAAEQRFCSEIRPLDAWCCINRMRGVHFELNR
ncbi:MAG: P-loop domain-containing protein [Acetatifactor sp.]